MVEGMQFDRGYVSPYFVTDPERMVAEYENCRLLLVDKKIATARDMIGILEGAIRGGYPLLLMAEDIEQVGQAGFALPSLLTAHEDGVASFLFSSSSLALSSSSFRSAFLLMQPPVGLVLDVRKGLTLAVCRGVAPRKDQAATGRPLVHPRPACRTPLQS